MSNDHILVLAIDLDALINAKYSTFNHIDYNCSMSINDPRLWIHHLDLIMSKIQDQGFTLVPLIMTAKPDALPNYLVSRAVKTLNSLVFARDKSGKIASIADVGENNPTTYYAMRHGNETCNKVTVPHAPDIELRSSSEHYQMSMHETNTQYLAPVHICSNNPKGDLKPYTATLTALDMIENYFDIPKGNLFFLNSDKEYIKAAQKKGYSIINASALATYQSASSLTRKMLCMEMLNHAEQVILEQTYYLRTLASIQENDDHPSCSSNNRDLAYVAADNKENAHVQSNETAVWQGEVKTIPHPFEGIRSGASEENPSQTGENPATDPALKHFILKRLDSFFKAVNCCADVQDQIIPADLNQQPGQP
jgi:hypothetical protein